MAAPQAARTAKATDSPHPEYGTESPVESAQECWGMNDRLPTLGSTVSPAGRRAGDLARCPATRSSGSVVAPSGAGRLVSPPARARHPAGPDRGRIPVSLAAWLVQGSRRKQAAAGRDTLANSPERSGFDELPARRGDEGWPGVGQFPRHRAA